MSKQTHSRHRADLASHAAFSEHSGSDTWGVREHDRVIRPGDPGGERPVQPWPPTEDNPMTDTFDERGQYDNDHPEGPPPKYIPKERRSQPDASDPLREAARRVLREADRDTDAFIALRAALAARLLETPR